MKNYNLKLSDINPKLAKEVKKAKNTKPTWDEFWSMNEEEMKAYLTINNKKDNK